VSYTYLETGHYIM